MEEDGAVYAHLNYRDPMNLLLRRSRAHVSLQDTLVTDHVSASGFHRYVYNEVNQKFPHLPFSLRALEDEKQVIPVDETCEEVFCLRVRLSLIGFWPALDVADKSNYPRTLFGV